MLKYGNTAPIAPEKKKKKLLYFNKCFSILKNSVFRMSQHRRGRSASSAAGMPCSPVGTCTAIEEIGTISISATSAAIVPNQISVHENKFLGKLHSSQQIQQLFYIHIIIYIVINITVTLALLIKLSDIFRVSVYCVLY